MRIFRQGQGSQLPHAERAAWIFRRRREKTKARQCSIVAVETGREAPGLKQPIKGLRGDVACHVAQAILQIDAEIGEIDHFWMETN